MRKVFAICMYALAGFFVYMVCLLAFVDQPPATKWVIVAGFTLPALFFLVMGLTVTRFRRWKRDAGIVLLSGGGLTSFIIFAFVCLLVSDEFRQMMEPDALSYFDSYFSGGIFILSVLVMGVGLLKIEKGGANQAGVSGASKE